MADLLSPQFSTKLIFLFVVIIFPLAVVTEVDGPIWNQAQWETELKNFRLKYSPDVNGGADGPIPRLLECAFDLRNNKGSFRCPLHIKKVFVNEILLRLQYRGHYEDCNSRGTMEDVLLNPPKQVPGVQFEFHSYLNWQEMLINSKLQFCDPLKFLRCSPAHKCVCHLGSTWSPPNDIRPEIQDRNTCAFSHGSECFIGPRDGQSYFDPFKASGTESELTVQVAAPPCREEQDNCYTGEYLKEPTCLPEASLIHQITTLENWLTVTFLTPLTFNDECNIQDQNGFLTHQNETYEVRFKSVEAIRVRGTKFCDIDKFLTCGPSSKCECMSPSSRQDDQCVLPEEYDKCILGHKMKSMIMNKSIIWKAREKLMTGFANSVSASTCEGNLKCHSEMMEMYCTCPPGKTGQECEETLTKFLSVVRVPSLPTDVVGYPEKVKIFSHFNNKSVEFEKMFKLGEGAVCDWEIQNKAEMLVGRIRKLKYPGTSKTQDQYKDLTDSIDALTKSHQPQGICKDTLRCQFSTRKCVRQTRRNYLDDLRKELEKSKTLEVNEMGCSEFPKHFEDVRFGGDEYNFYGGEDEFRYELITQRHSDLLGTKAKFCMDHGSCSCSIPGTCVRPPRTRAEYYLSKLFLLVVAVATFIVYNRTNLFEMRRRMLMLRERERQRLMNAVEQLRD